MFRHPARRPSTIGGTPGPLLLHAVGTGWLAHTVHERMFGGHVRA